MLHGNSEIAVFQTPTQAAQAAANAVAGEIKRLLAANGRATTIFDGINQPITFFEFLVEVTGIDWTQVIVFQAAEYLLDENESSKSIQRFLTENLLLHVPIVTFHPLRGDAANQRAAASNFSALLAITPPDLACLGFDLLNAETSAGVTEEAVGFVNINGRGAVAITPRTVASIPNLFALGQGAAPVAARKHRNGEIFLAVQ